MGCDDSKTATKPQNIQKQVKDSKNARFAEDNDDEPASFQPEERNVTGQEGPKKKKKNNKKGTKNEEKFGQLTIYDDTKVPTNKAQKENVVRVRKIKQIENRSPQVQKWITDLVTKSRSKMAAMVPASEMEPNGANFSKPVIQYSPQKRGQILPAQENYRKRSQWSKPIAGEPEYQKNNEVTMGSSYVAVGQKIKSPYKIKQIERRLNEIRNGRLQDDRFKVEAIDSHHIIYL